MVSRDCIDPDVTSNTLMTAAWARACVLTAMESTQLSSVSRVRPRSPEADTDTAEDITPLPCSQAHRTLCLIQGLYLDIFDDE